MLGLENDAKALFLEPTRPSTPVLPPTRTFLTSWTSDALRMKDANTISTSCSTPNFRSWMSFSDTAGRSTAAPGRFTPFLLPKEPPFSTSVTRKSAPATKLVMGG
ncbi:unnamed protein product, partial [Gulo gulo]